MTDNTEAAVDDGTMTFWEHLEELRSRIIKMILAFAVGAGVAWWFKVDLLEWVATPFIEGWNKQDGVAKFHFPHPAALFIAYIKLSVLGGFVIALPIILYQTWAFVAPVLYAKEKRFAIPFVVSSCALFAGGGYFGWRIAFPIAFQYLLSFADLPLTLGLPHGTPRLILATRDSARLDAAGAHIPPVSAALFRITTPD